MSQPLPGLFPKLNRSDLRLVPVTTTSSWVVMLQARSGALDPQQYRRLLETGFVKGEQGRLFFPRPMERLELQGLCQILGGEMAVLEPEDAVILSGGEPFESQIPVNVRQGIGWWWSNNRSGLALEIQATLRDRDDEHAREILKRYSEGQWRNPARLKQWVEDALSGEINEVTEPILGLGVAWALSKEHDRQDPDPGLTTLRQQLAAYRGQELGEIEQRPAVVLATEHQQQSQLPPIGERVRWRNDAGELEAGVVKRFSDTDAQRLWVIPDQPNWVEGLTLPQTVAIDRHQLADVHAVQQRETTTADVTPATDTQVGAGEPEPTLVRATLQASDLPAAALRSMSSSEYPPRRVRTLTRLAMNAATGGISGIHPLSPRVGYRVSEETDLVYSFGKTLGHDLGVGPVDDDTPAGQDARLYMRDSALETFNEAQPETLPSRGKVPSLAVIPLGVSNQAMAPDNADAEALLESMEHQRVYALGIHPLKAWELLDNWDEFSSRVAQHNGSSATDRLMKGLFDKLTSRHSVSLRSLIPASESRLRWYVEHLAMDIDRFEDHSSDESLDRYVQRLSGGLFWHDPAEAARALEAITNADERPDWLRERVERNARVLWAVGDLAQASKAELDETTHPMLVLARELVGDAVGESVSAEQALAVLGIDLELEPELAGEIAWLHGVSLGAAHREVATQDEADTPDDRPVVGEASVIQLNRSMDSAQFAAVTLRATNARPEMMNPVVAMTNGLISGERNFDRTSLDKITTNRVGRIMALHGRFGLAFTEPVNPFEMTPEQTSQIPVTHLDVRSMAIFEVLGAAPGDALSPAALDAMARAGSGEQVGELDPNAQLERQKAINTALENVGEQLLHSSGVQQAMYPARYLVTDAVLNPQYTERLHQRRQQIEQGVAMWVRDQFPELWDNVWERLSEKVTDSLVNGNEMAIVAVRNTGKKVYFDVNGVSIAEIQKAKFNRYQAGEKKILQWKSQGVIGSKNKVRTFDALHLLRPDTLRALNEVREAGESEPTLAQQASDKRSNTGYVHGLSMKDMRGARDEVLDLINRAEATDRNKMVTKTRLWESPDWVGLRSPEDGTTPMEPAVAAFWNALRKETPSAPPADLPEVNDLYARTLLLYRDWFDEIRTLEQLDAQINDDGEMATQLGKVLWECRDHDFPVGDIMGKRFSGRSNVCDALRMARQRAVRATRDNSQWPHGVGQNKAAKRSGGGKVQVGAMPVLDQLRREGGEDHRAGRDISEHELIETFGFSGIEYGESMPQRERTQYLNQAYDAFMDMSRALNVQPATLSMGGTLGLAFGSRGRGGPRAALAHFEPDNNVINLTRLKGAGSLAHEFGHTIANYFSRRVTGNTRGPGDLAEMVTHQRPMGFLKTDQVGRLRKAVYDGFATIMINASYSPVTGKETTEASQSQSEDGIGQFDLQGRPVRSTFLSEALKAERIENRGSSRKREPYWPNPKELFARAFETWVDHRLKRAYPGFRNDYLVRQDKLETHSIPSSEQMDKKEEQKRPQLYPAGDELRRLDHAFTALFDTVKTDTMSVQHEYLGETQLPYLYSHDSLIERSQPADRVAFAQCAIDELVRMCGRETQLRWQRELRDDAGNSVAGRFSVIEGSGDDEPSLRGLIEMSMKAPQSAVYHEAFHYAQAFLITNDEQAMLDEAFAQGTALYRQVEQNLREQGNDQAQAALADPKEVQAYGYDQWVRGRLDLSEAEPVRTAFGEIRRWMENLEAVPKRYGFDTPEALFRNFYDGRLALRQELATLDASPALNSVVDAQVNASTGQQADSVDAEQDDEAQLYGDEEHCIGDPDAEVGKSARMSL